MQSTEKIKRLLEIIKKIRAIVEKENFTAMYSAMENIILKQLLEYFIGDESDRVDLEARYNDRIKFALGRRNYDDLTALLAKYNIFRDLVLIYNRYYENFKDFDNDFGRIETIVMLEGLMCNEEDVIRYFN